jgi:hypothetical protein
MTTVVSTTTATRPAATEAFEGRLRAALKARGLKLKRARFSYSICDGTGEKLADGLSLDNVGNFVRRKGYRTRGERAREAKARATLAAKGYMLSRGRAGLAVKDATGPVIGYPMSLNQVEMLVETL